MPLETFTLTASDGYALNAYHLTPEQTTPRAVILIYPGTGYRKEYYLKLAHYLAARGYAVLGVDYRGLAASAPQQLRGFAAQMHHWGCYDMAALLDHAQQLYASLPKLYFGHSAGGQLIGFMPNAHQLRAGITYGTSTGYWPWQHTGLALFCIFLWYVYVPASNALLGYTATRLMGFPFNLPAGVAAQWGRWCRRRDYLYTDLATLPPNQYSSLSLPVLACRATDDPIATARNARHLYSFWRAARVEEQIIQPADFGVKRIGHDGVFRAQYADKLWAHWAAWYDQQVS